MYVVDTSSYDRLKWLAGCFTERCSCAGLLSTIFPWLDMKGKFLTAQPLYSENKMTDIKSR
ncbi:hypothetical protein C8Q70DRAFT_1006604 [Cubamyces menziesii]|nr:hypothetical protein C8Q70DRAFT_1006604 [Cubamyces menziesii]